MRDNVCEENDSYPIKSLILENYVPWYCYDAYYWEYFYYVDPYPSVPLTFRIDPRNSEEYIDWRLGLQTFEAFYNFLLAGLGDIDSDGMPDEWERDYGLDALVDDAAGDIDDDGLTNIEEYNADTYPNDSDSDNDGMPDGWEVQYELDPLVDDAEEDLDGDSFSNLEEYLKETVPNDAGSYPRKFMPWLPLLLE